MFPRLQRLVRLGLLLLYLSACNNEPYYYIYTPEDDLSLAIESLYGSFDPLIQPDENALENIPQDPLNPLTPEKVKLGKFLFHETGIGLNPTRTEGLKTYSCSSCHNAGAGFQSGLRQGLGEGGSGFGTFGEGRALAAGYDGTSVDAQPIKQPTMLNTAFQEIVMWNGKFGSTGLNANTTGEWSKAEDVQNNFLGYQGLETQAIAGIKVHRLTIEENFIKNSVYQGLFDAAFPNIPTEARYSRTYAGLAIAAYMRTLLPNRAPFQQWLRGELGSLGEKETKGALLFFGKANCSACHFGPGLNGMGFHALGMKDLWQTSSVVPADPTAAKGRGGFTQEAEDLYAFKTPSLYNLADVRFFGHGGSFNSIQEVIAYKNKGVPQNPDVPTENLSPLFRPLGLNTEEISQLTAFLENSLRNPDLMRYQPDHSPMGSCFPNADTRSKADMGCDTP